MPVEEHPVFVAPSDPAIRIWRYMDFTKFVSLLENKGLFFARSDKLGDPFEGSYSRENEKLRPEVYANAGMTNFPFEWSSQFNRWTRKWTMINCWHMNEQESAAMWSLYARSNEAIAITSTYQKLRACLSKESFLGVVRYIDYESKWIREDNKLYPFVHKRLSFAHEQELRALVQQLPIQDKEINYTEDPEGVWNKEIDFSREPPEGGVWQSVNLNDLITEIYVAPMSPSWYRQLVEQVLERYKVSKRVIQSSLDKEPFF